MTIKGIRWPLVVYDVIVLALVDTFMLVIYGGMNELTNIGILSHFLVTLTCVLGARLLCKVYKQIWRYGGIQAYMRILASDAMAFLLNYVIVRAFHLERITLPWLLSIASLNLLGAMSMRMMYRYAYKSANSDSAVGRLLMFALKMVAGKKIAENRSTFDKKVKVAIIGAGRLGITLANDFLDNPMSNYRPEVFIDISEAKTGRTISNIPVIAENSATVEKLREKEVSDVIIAIADINDETRKRLYTQYSGAGFKVKAYDYPAVHTANQKRHLREFDIEELLFRKPIVVNNEDTKNYYSGKTILITGGGGSIGSEICRQLSTFNPKKLVILDVYENGAYEVQQELKIVLKRDIDVSIEIVSICNKPGLERVFAEYHPEIVVMAAAHKHVPLLEKNCIEAVENNIFGTLNTVELAVKYESERVIMVSTDKAVNPTNVMGATKRFCEMIVGAYSKLYDEGRIKTTFSSTRFGNVLGSAGSVIPIFKKQIANGGPVTVTDKRIIRYFMTIPEAAQLVLESGSMARNGELFVLDMGQPVKIYELAKNMIEISGFVPDKDIEIVETGLRPGEKLYEELLIKTEGLQKTSNSLIFIEKDDAYSMPEIEDMLKKLESSIKSGDDAAVKQMMHEVVPTYVSPEKINVEVN